MKKVLIALPMLALAACMEQPATMPEPDTDACKASSYQGLVGQPGAVLKSMMLPAGSRVIEPGQPVTMDYRIDRLNIEIGADGRVSKVACY